MKNSLRPRLGHTRKDVHKIDNLDKKKYDVERNLMYKTNCLSNRIDDLSLNRATKEELKILEMRVEKVEKKIFK